MYTNYGDRNFWEHGRLVDVEHSDEEINVIYCEPYTDTENLYLFAACTVNLTDDWIDWAAVRSYAGLNAESIDDDINTKELLAIAAIDYYGVENFSSPYEGYQFTKQEVLGDPPPNPRFTSEADVPRYRRPKQKYIKY